MSNKTEEVYSRKLKLKQGGGPKRIESSMHRKVDS